jgi:uncharacterized membrane protein (UPF0127 family)
LLYIGGKNTVKRIKIKNITKNNNIASEGFLADNFYMRLKGLIGKKTLGANGAICIKPCKSIHTFFMGFDIDAIFIDEKGGVCEIVRNIKPYRVSKYVFKAKYVIEILGGNAHKLKIELGDKIEIERI